MNAPPTDRRARLRRRMGCALAGVIALLGLALGEVLVRALTPRSEAELNLYVPDPDLGFRLHPGLHAGPVTINQRGLRDPERPLAKPPGVRRVVVLGDSFAFGASLPAGDSFVRQLDQRLGPKVEVIDSGVPGWGTVQQATWLEREGLQYDPDVVLVAFFVGNDVFENAGSQDFQVDDGALVPKQARPEHSWLRRLRDRSQLYRLLKHLPRQLADRLSGDSTRARWYHKIERIRLGVCATGQEASASWEPAWEATRAALTRIRDLAAPRPVVLLVIPDEFQVSAALRKDLQARYPDLDLSDYDLDLPQQRVAALADELGFVRVDPLPELRRRTEGGQVLYLPLDSHWNPAGHALAADLLAECPPLAALRQ